jgi:hypothetical protein
MARVRNRKDTDCSHVGKVLEQKLRDVMVVARDVFHSSVIKHHSCDLCQAQQLQNFLSRRVGMASVGWPFQSENGPIEWAGVMKFVVRERANWTAHHLRIW